jgi:riboflavin biosynthesis pyrimidine reductase
MDRLEASRRLEETLKKKEKKAVLELAAAGGYSTVEDRSTGFDLVRFQSPWIDRVFGGAFYRSREPRESDLPVVTLVFVQDRKGNVLTASGHPSELKGGPTDLHGIYEGLSRLDADAVAAGSKTVDAQGRIFSLWHPEWVALRRSLGKGLPPAQVIVAPQGQIDLDASWMFHLPDVPVFVITSSDGLKKWGDKARERPWIVTLDAGSPPDWRKALRVLKARGIEVLSLVGGPITATGAADQGVVTDLYLTTSAVTTGLSGTPWYRGEMPPPMDLVVRKAGQENEAGIVFEHFVFKR